jgi:hypothetical protein
VEPNPPVPRSLSGKLSTSFHTASAVDGEGGVAMIDQDDAHFTAIIGVDGAGRVHHRDTLFQGQAGSGADLCFETGRQGDGQSGRHQGALTWCDHHFAVDRGH